MPKAVWNGTVLAESDDTVVVEGNHYFPPESINREYFEPVDRTTVCGWKGTANYYDIVVDGEVNEAAAWTYRDPSRRSRQIKDHVAFWGGVHVN